MKITQTSAQMLELMRSARGYDHRRDDCTVEKTEGMSPDDRLIADLRSRYLEMLDRGDIRLISTENIVADCKTSLVGIHTPACRIDTPDGCRRAFNVRLLHWSCDAPVLPRADFDTMVARQLNPFSAATADTPVAVAATDGPHPVIFAWPPSEVPAAVNVTAAVDHGASVYTFDDSAINHLIYNT